MAAAATSSTVRSLLNRAHSPGNAETIFKDKIQYKPLHLRATSPDPTSRDARAQRRLMRQQKREKALRKRPKPKPLSAKEKRISGVHDIPKELQKYDIYVPLNEMWVKYMWEILGLKEGQQTFINAGGSGNMLATADYHGAKVTVVRSRCSSLLNLKGIVAKDTKFTFQVITEQSALKIIPKRGSIFKFEIPQPTGGRDSNTHPLQGDNQQDGSKALAFEVVGSQFEIRPADRSRKAFKPAKLSDF